MLGDGEDQHGSPGLSIYMRADGAAFQFVVNQESMDPAWINDEPYSDDDLDSEGGNPGADGWDIRSVGYLRNLLEWAKAFI